jgi:hypothetical protein
MAVLKTHTTPDTINKKNTTIELRKQCRLEIAEKRMQEHQNITNARSGDSTLF